ncbi:hypothetical protein [Gordonia paraffinivorans]|uniref:Uncharacterized protein n=1 Tax=Gordonia paraffinivorans TaxID=175628 RepID=A0ABD7V0U6_9ACTN|nr:hypothetical protein [Gordonia paraffinivorans]MCD2146819.1 hypothetical protein [Gordonia paraffinivorans]VFA87954.1 Uncharacterised protein [Gordonia paraffinivorans]
MSSTIEAGPVGEDPDGPAALDDGLITDPDLPHEYPHESAFAFGDSTPIGVTERLARESAAYEAAARADRNPGHAVGGSAGSTEGR